MVTLYIIIVIAGSQFGRSGEAINVMWHCTLSIAGVVTLRMSYNVILGMLHHTCFGPAVSQTCVMLELCLSTVESQFIAGNLVEVEGRDRHVKADKRLATDE